MTDLPIDDATEFGREIKARVMQYTGIPVSVGIAQTKTLCKIANEIAKKDASCQGVLDLIPLAGQKIDELLAQVPIEDVWGVGRKYALFLSNYGIFTARDLKYADEKWIRRQMSVVMERTVLELRGIRCLPLEHGRKAKKGIMCSKSFGKEVTDFHELEEAVATYTARAAEKLRSENGVASLLTVFIHTSHFKQDTEQYANSFSGQIGYPTAFTPQLITYALAGLKAIYRQGYSYKKAGVYLTKISPESAIQPDLFGDFSLGRHCKEARLMAIVDAINSIYGRNTLFFAIQGIKRPWSMQQNKLSPHFTTRWSDILTI